MKKFLIIGAGYFGSNLAKNLASQGAEVIILDKDEKKIDALKNYVSKSVVVDARDIDMLKKLIPEDIDYAIVGIGRNLEANLIVCLNLQALGIKNIASKCHTDQHRKILEMMGIKHIINPEEEVANILSKKLLSPNVLENIPLKDGYNLLEVKVPQNFVGKTLREIDLRNQYGINIIGIRTKKLNEEGDLVPFLNLIPDGNTKLREDDILIVIGEEDTLRRFFG